MTDINLLLMKLGITANYNGYWYLVTILEMLDTSAGTGRDERKNDAGGYPCR